MLAQQVHCHAYFIKKVNENTIWENLCFFEKYFLSVTHTNTPKLEFQ